MRRTLVTLVTAALAWPGLAAAEGIPIRPGSWKISSRVAVSIAPRPREQESTRCIARDSVGADELTGRSTLCDNRDVRIDGDTMTWKIVCREQMAGNEGEGRLTVDGDLLEGAMELRGLPQQDRPRVVVTTRWQGERLGDCE